MKVAVWPLSLAGVGALALGVGVAVVDALPVGVVADDSFYVILARALASGEGYRYLNVPGHPAATHFPPGYPALLAILSLVVPAFPDSVVASNVMAGGSSSRYPAGNFFPSVAQLMADFTDVAKSNFRLGARSSYRKSAKDGTDLGANFDQISRAQLNLGR